MGHGLPEHSRAMLTARMATERLGLAFLLCTLSCSASRFLRLDMPSFNLKRPVTLAVGVYVSETESKRVDMNGPWRIETGDALGPAAVSCFTQMFGRAIRVSSEDAFDSDSVDLIAVPEIRQFYLTRRTSAGLLLQCRLIDRSRKVVYSGMVYGRGPSNEALEWVSGQAGYVQNMEESPARAFADAFHELALDIIAHVDFTPYAK